ncbi:response regulator transcription factor [Uliginosibacterium sp. 31-16]|uniref:response regulator n=1 Tax=Uliginosibacterium sp. 31-16 TaxID=3068315 RepID=UPI00273F9FD2|nr:response regulator transcription factor [Uliginosibacterium sp. 31-16]MDP5238221.1 response regulator transcription factor [Uliginosibacterium sp. 31-16]
MSEQILVIDDDSALAAMLGEYLGQRGLAVSVASTLAQGEALLATQHFDALILDGMLPDGDGFDLCRSLRQRSSLPILMLTARGEEIDRIVGLELGADDYLPKPFNPRELLARLRSLLRRSQLGAMAPGESLRFGRLELDRGAVEARLDGHPLTLTAHQFALLWALASHAGRVLSRETLLELARGDALENFDRSIDVHISRIRAEIEDDPREPRRIVTVRGAGYVFAQRQDDSA